MAKEAMRSTALINLARAGDVTAAGELINECRPALIEFINGRLPYYLRTQVAEELIQDAYALALRMLPKFGWRNLEGDLGDLSAWLREIAAKRLADWWKYIKAKKRDYRRLVVDQSDGPCDSGTGLVEGAAGEFQTASKEIRERERVDALRAAMQRALSNQEKDAIDLRYLKGLSVTDVAAVMELSPGYIKNLCLTGKQKLREELGRSSQFFSSR